jgi:alcohol dehydrogenase
VVVGDRVVVPFQISCGSCDACRAGHTGNCTTVHQMAMYGFGASGGDWGGALSDLVRVPYADAMLVPLPPGLEPVAAAGAADNISDAWRTVAPHLRARPGAEVLIAGGGGAGGIGLYAAAAAVALGAATVDYVDDAEDRLEIAKQLGANAVEGEPRRGRYPITVDARGDEQALGMVLRSTAPDGFCTNAAPYFRPPSEPLPLLEMYTRCVTLHSGRCHARSLMPEVLAALADGSLRADLVTDRVVEWDAAADVLPEHRRKTVFARAA